MNIEQPAFNGTIDPESGKELIGAVGNEQHSTGAHLHMQSDVEGNPVNLFAWADAHRNGILAQSDVQNLYFKFNAELGVLVNQDNKLILQRKVEGNEGVSRVYVWTAGFNKDSSATQEEVVWKKKKFVDANGVLQDAFTWVKKTDENYRWDASLQDFIPLLPS